MPYRDGSDVMCSSKPALRRESALGGAMRGAVMGSGR
jgi:hypothetical protein